MSRLPVLAAGLVYLLAFAPAAFAEKEKELFKTKLHSEAFLLLTATPHQGEEDHSRFKHLLALLDDAIDFSALEERNLFSEVGDGRKFTEYVIRTPKKDVTDAEGRKVF